MYLLTTHWLSKPSFLSLYWVFQTNSTWIIPGVPTNLTQYELLSNLVPIIIFIIHEREKSWDVITYRVRKISIYRIGSVLRLTFSFESFKVVFLRKQTKRTSLENLQISKPVELSIFWIFPVTRHTWVNEHIFANSSF